MTHTAGSGIIVWEIFSWHTLRFLVPIKDTAAYLDTVADHVPEFMTTENPFFDGHFQQNNTLCNK